MTKRSLKAEAIQLRRQGLSYNEILEQVPVAKSTLSLWLRDVPLSKKKKKKLENRMKSRALVGARKAGQKNKLRAQHKRSSLLNEARNWTTQFSMNEDTFAYIGAALYWAEGSKGENFTFSNSDPDLACLYVRWARETLRATSEDFRCNINVYLNNGLSYEDVKQFWSRRLDISTDNFRKPTIGSPSPERGKKKGKLPYGVISITLKKPQRFIAKYLALTEQLGNDIESFITGV